ncbi:MAG: UTP--glucose-1-phosphate uridylyltransferase [Deltaproteobacteria bacterium]
MNVLDDPRLDFALLERFGFERDRFERDYAAMQAGTLSPETAIVTDPIEPADTVVDLDFTNEEARAAGEAALRAGKVASVVLNGGMATRFGGVVKGVVEVFDGLTFIALKARDAKRAHETYGRPVPLVLMNSFATDASTWEHVNASSRFGLAEEDLLSFTQSISVRLDEQLGLFIGDDGQPSYHAPGHGDFFSCIRRSGVLEKLRARGVEILLFSNVDNLGATVEPSVIGHHILGGKPMTAEVTEKRRTASGAWDKGGAPARVAGFLQLVEGFRFPPDFEQHTLPDFSTNNMLFDAAAIDRPIGLQRHVVKKKVDGRAAIQLESITCEASGVRDDDGGALLPLSLLRVPREGERGRFFPVKEPADLDAMREILKARLG